LPRERDGEVPGVITTDTDALRLALAMVRADWQDDEDGWDQLWAVADDRAELARVLTRMCRQNIDRLASVAGLSTAEMLHRMAGQLIPHRSQASSTWSTSAADQPGKVRISGSPSVTRIVCSNCADFRRSRVTTVHPSSHISHSGVPRLSIGSMVNVMPSSMTRSRAGSS
jgi:hypothetical protein